MAEDLKLWYREPVRSWYEALPVGNGRLGGMVFGDALHERIQLNEDTLYSGRPRDTDVREGHRYLPEIRRLVMQEGDLVAANELCKKLKGPYNESYQPLGNLLLSMRAEGAVEDYRLELDLETAVVTVSYRVGTTRFTREVFVSTVDQVLGVRLCGDRPSMISFDATLDSLLEHRLVPAPDETLVLQGYAFVVEPGSVETARR